MKRFHVHVDVHDLKESIRFYSALFAAEPAVLKDDYAKWQLDDPRINFAILDELASRLAQADVAATPQKGASCCYARSDKHWTLDPQGIAWGSFHTLGLVPVYGEETATPEAKPRAKSACCSA